MVYGMHGSQAPALCAERLEQLPVRVELARTQSGINQRLRRIAQPFLHVLQAELQERRLRTTGRAFALAKGSDGVAQRRPASSSSWPQNLWGPQGPANLVVPEIPALLVVPPDLLPCCLRHQMPRSHQVSSHAALWIWRRQCPLPKGLVAPERVPVAAMQHHQSLRRKGVGTSSSLPRGAAALALPIRRWKHSNREGPLGLPHHGPG
mmetsp:Transcript_50574/g.146759  ORF Transcript_50574/g.146759 Transcript_50574/m.146759 type:complete len:207 (-) Transcript_50574:302-922(-)